MKNVEITPVDLNVSDDSILEGDAFIQMALGNALGASQSHLRKPLRPLNRNSWKLPVYYLYINLCAE